MVEKVLIFIALLAALLYLARSLYRRLSGKGCSCSSCPLGDCPSRKTPAGRD